MYGDDDYSKRESRPLSFITSPLQESIDAGSSYSESSRGSRRPLAKNDGNAAKKTPTSPATLSSPRNNAFDTGPLSSSSLSLREHNASDTANTKFPLSDMDYESNPNAIAQELNNLQALRRMSMDVGSTSDPDLPPFQGLSVMLSVAPTGDDHEDDPSRLFWVPARVHPELAPMEFKTFLENRVQSIKRRSGEQDSLSPDGMERSGSGSSLRRKRSMLSRQIDNDGGRGAVGYEDGAEQLERKKSQSSQSQELKIADLQELDALVRDPTEAMRKLSLDATKQQTPAREDTSTEDMPILPQAPGIGLRRSTRTTYRKGSLRKGERVPFSKRAGSIRGAETDGDEARPLSPVDGRPSIDYPLTKTQSDPSTPESFSRSNLPHRMQSLIQIPISSSSESIPIDGKDGIVGQLVNLSPEESLVQPPQPGMIARSHSFPKSEAPVPRIVETPPQFEEPFESTTPKQGYQFPERSSSQTNPTLVQPQPVPEPPTRSNRRPTLDRQAPPSAQPIPRISTPSKTLNDMAQHPSPLPGSSARTDALTFIPTFEEKKPEKKSKKEKDDSEGSSLRKPSWGWFKGSDEKEKKDKKKDDDHKDGKRGKAKASSEKGHDNARLDVLQSTMDTAVPRGRESLLLDRDSIDNKLQEERKKEGSRKSGGESKKEKDGIFSSFFGSSKKKGDRDSGGKKSSSLRTLSPDPSYRQLKPDVDYNWTRFSILEERAIYRMAHIKLANPRRALYSQVLLSNFMYSYLAKVQQMHPQMQIPQSALQKKQEVERRQREQEQQYLEEQQQQQQQHQDSGDPYHYDYHRVGYLQYWTELG